MKDELGGEILPEFVGLKMETYSYLKDDGSEDEKSKRHKEMCHKKENLNLKIAKTV